MARPDFDPSDAVDFWDLTNRQDWAVCERQQAGTRSRAYDAGRYSLMEDMVHAFDLMVADGYAADGVTTRFAPRHDKWSLARPRVVERALTSPIRRSLTARLRSRTRFSRRGRAAPRWSRRSRRRVRGSRSRE